MGRTTHASSHGKRGYFVQDENAYHLHPFPSGQRSTKQPSTTHYTSKPDHESERSILPNDIRKTTEVLVSYDEGLKDKHVDPGLGDYGGKSIHPEDRF
ncbi:MAG: hypothetical protein M1830_008094 [Pleopsidium flavum]|nr:MAG: hypothetical protein M1830_008094 [Pleopsidium flavum]